MRSAVKAPAPGAVNGAHFDEKGLNAPPPVSGISPEGAGLPQYNHNGHLITKGIHPDGESGRTGLHPLHFLQVCGRSSSKVSASVNILWPFVPVAIAMHFARPGLHKWIFVLNYIAMVPTANLIGFAGQELARKIPKVIGSYASNSALSYFAYMC